MEKDVSRWSLGIAIFAALSTGAIGCTWWTEVIQPPGSDDLPDEVPALVELGDRLMRDSPTVARVRLALAAYEKAIHRDPKNTNITWRAGKATIWLADNATSKDEKLSLADKGVNYTQAGIEQDPSSVENTYYLALNLGIRANSMLLGALKVIPELMKVLKRSIELDETFDRAGALRVMGMVYAKAPPWPASIGDTEEAVILCSRAVELFPDEPLNRLFLGEALYADEQYKEARKELKKVLSFPPEGDWARIGRRYRKYAADLLQKVERRLKKKGRSYP